MTCTCSFYWAICTAFINVDTPQTAVEVALSIFLLLLGFLVTAYVTGAFSSAMTELNHDAAMERARRDQLDAYLQNNNIPSSLRKQVHFCLCLLPFQAYPVGKALKETHTPSPLQHI